MDGKVAALMDEHVGEPRLVIALCALDAVHVGYKFVSLLDAAVRVDDTQVLWEWEQLLTQVLNGAAYQYPHPDPQWIEDRFWIWVHYAVTKIARGKYFEGIEFLSFLRTTVLSPLALKQNGMTPSGVRTIEKRLPAFSQQLQATVVQPEKGALVEAMDHAIELYLELRAGESVMKNLATQKMSKLYFDRELKLSLGGVCIGI